MAAGGQQWVYPVLLGGATAAAVGLVVGGLSPLFVPLIVLPIVVATLLLAEARWPAGPAPTRRMVAADVCHALVNLTVPAVVAGGVTALATRLPDAALWPRYLPLGVQLPFALLLSELGVYGMHRLAHGRLLWRFHRVHHGPDRLYWLNATRFHPLDLLWLNAASVGPLGLLGAPPEVMAVLAVFAQTGAFLQHCNLALGDRFSPVFNTPALHQWHHASERTQADCNYGGTLVMWDRLFGTWQHPPGRPARLGPGTPAPEGYLAHLTAPFRKEVP